ncbi:lytic murein transglycosylase [Aureimonas sp. AU20]|uniref:lytic murein transglycosylase n=1 Tax=Aureimonas sp. AU20 TaxID=1349819 RepID=UPI000785666E|nr:lytic murein transglycosylase [Aureimonas sp. AU20]
MMKRLATLLVAFAALASPAAAASKPEIEAGFRRFLDTEIWPEARAGGVSRPVFDAAFRGVKPNLTLPDLQLPGEKPKVEEVNRQAEFQSPAGYFNEQKIAGVVQKGRALLQTHAALLKRIEAETGVPGPIVLAVWGRESGYGAAKIPYNAFEVLSTKAYLSRRKDMFRAELIAALQIVQEGHLTVADMKSSWAGALGQPQFMPSKFRALAVDEDGDGRPDIWRSVPDTLASIAHYLQKSGWQRGRPWGYEASFPAGVSCTGEGPDRPRPIADFAKAGVARAAGRPFPAAELARPGHLLMPAGRAGPGFVATPNFYVIKEYNNSDLYALFIGHVADRIAGGGAFAGRWPGASGLTRGDVSRLQERLQRAGYDVGGTDGLAGFKTRRSIGEAEEKLGLPATCWPTPALAKRLG